MSVAPRKRAARSSKKPAKPSIPAAQSDDTPALTLLGDFPGQVTVIPRALCTLIMGTGSVQEERIRHVLVPYVEMKFAGIRQAELIPSKGEDQELDELFSRVIPLENALWLLSDIARDIRYSCLRLRNVSAGPEVFEHTRIRQAREYAEQLMRQAELTASILGALIAEPETPSTEQEPSTRLRRKTVRSAGESPAAGVSQRSTGEETRSPASTHSKSS